jgi:prephenate dehydrogenase
MGLALKARKGNYEVVGHDRDYGRAGEAKKAGAIDKAEWNLPSALDGAGIVIVATPLSAVEKVFSLIAEFLAPGAIVTDTATLKQPVIGWAQTILAGRASYVGGNPIVSDPGPDRKPSATLFEGRTYCIVPDPAAANSAVDQVVRLAQTLGANPLFLDAVEHDSHVAAVGQLPTLLASALMNLTSANPSWRDGQRLADSAFGAATAMALIDPAEQVAQLQANRETMLLWLRTLQTEIGELTRLLDNDLSDELKKTLENAQDQRARWQPGLAAQSDVPTPELPRARDQFSQWFIGKLGDRKKK